MFLIFSDPNSDEPVRELSARESSVQGGAEGKEVAVEMRPVGEAAAMESLDPVASRDDATQSADDARSPSFDGSELQSSESFILAGGLEAEPVARAVDTTSEAVAAASGEKVSTSEKASGAFGLRGVFEGNPSNENLSASGPHIDSSLEHDEMVSNLAENLSDKMSAEAPEVQSEPLAGSDSSLAANSVSAQHAVPDVAENCKSESGAASPGEAHELPSRGDSGRSAPEMIEPAGMADVTESANQSTKAGENREATKAGESREAGDMAGVAEQENSSIPGGAEGLPEEGGMASADSSETPKAGKTHGGPRAKRRRAAASAERLEPTEEAPSPGEKSDKMDWYILKVATSREEAIREALKRRIKIAGLDYYFGEIIVPMETVTEFKGGKKRITKRKLYPGYLVVQMEINDETWFLIRETPGIGDFAGAAGKPAPMLPHEVARILARRERREGEAPRLRINFNTGDRVKVNEGTFENFQGEVAAIDEANGRVTVMINIFGRSTPVELQFWQVELI